VDAEGEVLDVLVQSGMAQAKARSDYLAEIQAINGEVDA